METPWREHLKLGILVTMGGLAASALVHLAISRPRAWTPAGVVGLMAFLVWSFYYGYIVLIPGLLMAVIAAAIVGRW